MPTAPFETAFAENIYNARYKHHSDGNWAGTARRVAGSVMPALYHAPGARGKHQLIESTTERVCGLIERRQFMPGGRYLYAAGRDLHQVQNCLALRAEDTREGWAALSYKAEMALMTGAGIGVWYGDLRAAGTPISRTGGEASGPVGKALMVNELGRFIIQGGQRRSAIWAGLPWWHGDIFAFMEAKDWPEWLRQKKAEDWTVSAPFDMTNISVTLDDWFFLAHSNRGSWEAAAPFMREHGDKAPDGGAWHPWAERVYNTAVEHMLRHGEPGFSIDRGIKSTEVLRNACCEFTSADDSDPCNLGSIVMPRFETPAKFGAAVRNAVGFLTAGTLYSHVPYTDKDVPRGNRGVDAVREQNRRLGLGLIGLHEFLMRSGVRYGTDEAFEVLDPYMAEYGRALEYAIDFQDTFGLSHSKGATAIAPAGTIAIVAESTPGSCPLFAAAEQRQVKAANVHGPDTYTEHVVVDPTAARLIRDGVDPSLIEDAHSLSLEPERRLAQQVYLQRHTDHAISSTINLAEVVTDPVKVRELGDVFMRYIPELKGLTVYPDGARAGQPRTPVDLEWALNHNAILETDENTCSGGVCGI